MITVVWIIKGTYFINEFFEMEIEAGTEISLVSLRCHKPV
jgi:hypothetical protein